MSVASESSVQTEGGAAPAVSELGRAPDQAELEAPAKSPDLSASGTAPRRSWLLGLAALVTLASLFAPLSASGIWDPHELKIADLARRIALSLLGAKELVLEGAVNTVPTLGELARGQLPFTSVALGFRLFGLHEWAGRLPLALWGLIGVAATYALVSRFADRVAGAFAALALSTMPLYFLHSRTILGDIVTMSAMALAVAGLTIACFDRPRPGEQRALRRGLWFLVGLAGLGAGFGARGVLLGVAVPAAGVGLAWLVSRASRDRFGNVCGVIALAIGAWAVIVGTRVLLRSLDQPGEFSMLVGTAIAKERQLPTFDLVIHQLGHALFPWSAFLPFALGRVLAPPPDVEGVELERHGVLRVTLITVVACGFAAYGALAPAIGPVPFGPVFALAALAGLALRDFDRGAPGSRAVAMGVAAFAILFYQDFKNFPDKGLSAFAVHDARFPESFKEAGTRYIKYGTLAFSGFFFFTFMEQTSRDARRFARDEYLAWPRALRTLYSGNLLFSVLVLEAALAGFAALTYLSDKYLRLKQIQGLGAMARNVAEWGYLVLPALLLLPLVLLFVRDVFRSLYSEGFGLRGSYQRKLFERAPRIARLRPSRGVGAALAVTAFAVVLSLGYYPALAAQISPKEVFESYRRFAQQGDELGMLGAGSGSASYYAGRDVPTFSNVATAFAWLMEGTNRRWLVIRSSDLPQMNSTYRGRVTPADNLPVLDARSSEILLVSNRLAPGERNQNPFRDWILAQAPMPSHRVDGNFGGQLDAIGWDIKTPDGTVVDSIAPGKRYLFVIYYKVQSSLSGTWETFVHIDGFQRRFNGDHKTLEGKYAFHLWRPGDYIADVYEFSLEPNFTPGEYRVFYGLFMGSRRLEVKRGRHHEDRLEAGMVRVR